MDRWHKRYRPLPGEDGYGCRILGSVIGAVGQVAGGFLGGRAAEEAGEAQRESLQDALRFQSGVYGQQRADTAPYREAGAQGLNRLQYLLGVGGVPEGAERPLTWDEYALRYDQPVGRPWSGQERANIDRAYNAYREEMERRGAAAAPADDPARGSLLRSFTEEDFRADPGYQFRLEEGEKALNRAAAARGMYSNPATVRELQRFGGGLADQTYGDAFNRFQTEQGNRFNRLASLAGLGQTGVSQTMGASQQLAGLGTGTYGAMGQSASDAILNAANARISGLTGAGSSLVDQYNINRMLRLGGYGSPGAFPGVGGPGGF